MQLSTLTGPTSTARTRFTFHGNRRDTRHGWLRLTPAYSQNLVRELIQTRKLPRLSVLDPFSGTGTTVLCGAELGVPCDGVELNPFLVWLGNCKIASYSEQSIDSARVGLARLLAAVRRKKSRAWVPPLHNIEKWWGRETLDALSRAFAALPAEADMDARALDLLRLTFCRTLIATANVSFGHQSMSFKNGASAAVRVDDALENAFESLALAARTPLEACARRIVHGDARLLQKALGKKRYGLVVTSPPYANRMSYIRELRPYMYWLGHLQDKRGAGELDWRAIGGTWGVATSNLTTWQPNDARSIRYPGFERMIRDISRQSPVLGTYVLKYFHDMNEHARALARVVAPGGQVHYVVGNSKFYDVVVPVQAILAALFAANGFGSLGITTLRKRTSKAELFEYAVHAERLTD